MNASSRGTKAIAKVFIRSCKPQNTLMVCTKHINQLTPSYQIARRTYSSTPTPTPTPTSAPAPTTSSGPCNVRTVYTDNFPKISVKTHDIHTGIILSRPPLLTPELTSFEKAFFFYQKRLNERLAVPFPRYFYYKKDSPEDSEWKIKWEERGKVPAKELGPYNAYGKTAWNDELLYKDRSMTEPRYIIEQLVKDARVGITEDGVVVKDPAARAEGVEMPRERTTEADLTNNLQRLDRKLDRTLYLVVKNKGKKVWSFPSAQLLSRESLYQAAERILVQSCGPNMNTWIVSHVPITHHVVEPVMEEGNEKKMLNKGRATFFMKGRIMTGQADITNNKFDYTSFRWLTKEELEDTLSSHFYHRIRNSLHSL
ncbi:hypothetical protein K3495_g843 [Podosphaera aphanis]|nr:hypothetical protein K3495_g843 [Podosphaera aphanis]